MTIKKLRNFTVIHGYVEPLFLLLAGVLIWFSKVAPVDSGSLFGRVILGACVFFGVGPVVGAIMIAKPSLALGIPKREVTEKRLIRYHVLVLRCGPGAINGIGLMVFLLTNKLSILIGSLAGSVVLAQALYSRSKSLASKYLHGGHSEGPASGGGLGTTPSADTQGGGRSASPAAKSEADQGFLDSFGVDAVARGKVLRLSLLVPPVAVATYLAMYLASGAGAMARGLIGVVALLAFVEAACGFYGKVARLITLPEVPFSSMSCAGQKLTLAVVAALFLAIGVLLGLMAYAAFPARFRDFVIEFRNALQQSGL